MLMPTFFFNGNLGEPLRTKKAHHTFGAMSLFCTRVGLFAVLVLRFGFASLVPRRRGLRPHLAPLLSLSLARFARPAPSARIS
jgi:hypothetical protein